MKGKGILTRAKSAQSIFPLHFNKTRGPYQKLEDYCNGRLKDKDNKLSILGSTEPNVYRGELSETEVTEQFLSVSNLDEEGKAEKDKWEGCLGRGTPSCKDHARGKKPCYCRYLFRGHHMAPVYLLHIPQIGLGVFARKEIKVGEFILDYQGEFHWADDPDDAEAGRYSVKLTTMDGEATELDLDASRIGGLARFLNHSCDPNVEAYPVLMNGKVRVVIMATKDIPPFQQLCWNYGPEYFTKRKLGCLCGSEECKVISNNNDKSKGEREAYLKFLEDHQQTGPLGGKQPFKLLLTALKRPGTSSSAVANKRQKMDVAPNSSKVSISQWKQRGRKAGRTPGLEKVPEPSTSTSSSVDTSSTGGSTPEQENQSRRRPPPNPAMAWHKFHNINNVASVSQSRRLVKKKKAASRPVIPVRISARIPTGTTPKSYKISRKYKATGAPAKKDIKKNPLTFVTARTRNWDATLSGLFEERNNALPSNQEDYDLCIGTLMSIYNSKAFEGPQAAGVRRIIPRAEHDAQIDSLRAELEAQRDYWMNRSMEFENQNESRQQVPSTVSTPSGEGSGHALMIPTITKAVHDQIVRRLRYEMGADVDYWKRKAEEMKRWISDNVTVMPSFLSVDTDEDQQFSYLERDFDVDINTLNPTMADMETEDDDQSENHQGPASAVASGRIVMRMPPMPGISNPSPEKEDVRLTDEKIWSHVFKSMVGQPGFNIQSIRLVSKAWKDIATPIYREARAPMKISQISCHPHITSYEQMQRFFETMARSDMIPVQSYHIKGNFSDGIPEIMNDFFRVCGSHAVSLQLFHTEDFQNTGFTLDDIPIPNLGRLKSLSCKDFNVREGLGCAQFVRKLLNGARTLEEFHVGTTTQLKKTGSLEKLRQLEENISKRIPNSLRVLKLNMYLSGVSFNNLIGIGLKLKKFTCDASNIVDAVAFYQFLKSQAATLEVLRLYVPKYPGHPHECLPIQEPVAIEFPPLPKVTNLDLGYGPIQPFCFLQNFPQLHVLDIRGWVDSESLEELLTHSLEEASSVKKLYLPKHFPLAPLVPLLADSFPNVTHLFLKPTPTWDLGIVETLQQIFARFGNVEELEVIFPEQKFNLDSVLSGVSEKDCERIGEEDFDTVELDELQTNPSILKLTKLRKLVLDTSLDEYILTNFSAHFIFLRMASLKELRIYPSKLTPRYIELLRDHIKELKLIQTDPVEDED